MKKIFALCASVALLGSVAAQAADARGPMQLNAKQMDAIAGGQTRTINQTANNNYQANYNTTTQTATATAYGNYSYNTAVAANSNSTRQRNSISQRAEQNNY
jgi:hypothetical protein